MFANLKEIEFMGGKYLVSNPPEEYLTAKYGPNWITPKEDYEKDVLDQVAKFPVANDRPVHGQPATKIRVFNLREELVSGAGVSVVGLAALNTDANGYVEFGLPYKDFYAIVIKFEDHEKILYQELLSIGASYVYTPDATIWNLRLLICSISHRWLPNLTQPTPTGRVSGEVQLYSNELIRSD